jgi:hypothetical protein
MNPTSESGGKLGDYPNKTGSNFMLVQFRGRDNNDLQYFQNWRY